MKLFILINSLLGGGAEKVVLNLTKILPIDKIFLLEKDIKYELPDEKAVFLSNMSSKTSSILKTLFIPLYVLKLYKKVNKNDIILSFLERSNYVNILTSLISKHKAIISVRMSQLSGRSKCHPYNFLSKLLYPKADLIICVSKTIAKELQDSYNVPSEKLKVIYNFIDFDEISNKIKEPLDEYQKIFNFPTLITLGRLTKEKGQWYLLRIFKEVKKNFPDTKLIILGDGELKNNLINYSQHLGFKTFVWDRDKLSEDFDVYFLGFQKNPFKFIRRAKIFVFPSLWEGLPNALVEAMACSIPVISSDCRGGPREILAPDTDFNFETKEPEFAKYGVLMPVFKEKNIKRIKVNEPLDKIEKMWLQVIEEFLKNRELRENYSYKSYEKIKEFDIKIISQEWEKIFTILI